MFTRGLSPVSFASHADSRIHSLTQPYQDCLAQSSKFNNSLELHTACNPLEKTTIMTDSEGDHTPSTVVEGAPGQQSAESVPSSRTPDQEIATQERPLRVKPKRHWPQYLASKYDPPRGLTFRQLCGGYPNHLAGDLLVEMHQKGLTAKDILEMLPSDVQADMNGRSWMEIRMQCALARAGLVDDSSAPSSPTKSAPPSRPTTPKPFNITPRKRKQKEGDMPLPNMVSPNRTMLTAPSLTPTTQTDVSSTPSLLHDLANRSNITTSHQSGSQVPISQAGRVLPDPPFTPLPLPSDDPFLKSCREEIRKHRALIVDISQYKPGFIQIRSQEAKANDVDLQWLTWCDRVNNSLRHSNGLGTVGTDNDCQLILHALERLLATHKSMHKKAWIHEHPEDHHTDVIAKAAYRDAKEDVLKMLRDHTVKLESERYQLEAGIATWRNTADAQHINDYGGRYGPYGVPLTIGAIQHGEDMNRAVRQRLDQEAEADIRPHLAAMASYDPQSAEHVHSAVSNGDATMRPDSARVYQADQAHTTRASNGVQYPQPALQRSGGPAKQSPDGPRVAPVSTTSTHEPTGPFAPGYTSWAELDSMPLNQGTNSTIPHFSSFQSNNCAAVSMCPTFKPPYPTDPGPSPPLPTAPPLTIDPRTLHLRPPPANHRSPLLTNPTRTINPHHLNTHHPARPGTVASFIPLPPPRKADKNDRFQVRHDVKNPRCWSCREKPGTRCDRGRPACGYCVRHGRECEYPARVLE